MQDHGYKTSQINVNGVKINYVKTGDGPGLVLIHGLRNNWYGWGRLIPYLEKNFTLYVVDLPGFGCSGRLANYSIKIEADYVTAFIKLLKPYPIGIVGLSMGSSITAEVAKVIGQSLQGIVLTGPVLREGNTVPLLRSLKYLMKTMGSNRITTYLMKKIMDYRISSYTIGKYLSMHKFNKELIDEYGLEGGKQMHAKAYVQLGVSVSEYNLLETLVNYKYPVLLIYGKSDRASRPKIAQEKVVPASVSAACVIIEKAGHWVPVEQPEQTAQTIINFFQSLR